jgi:hypothetical protein
LLTCDGYAEGFEQVTDEWHFKDETDPSLSRARLSLQYIYSTPRQGKNVNANLNLTSTASH